jgi:hypothetical protein
MPLTAMMVIVAGFVTMTSDPGTSRLLLPLHARTVQPAPVGTVADAGLGSCSTDFAVKDAAGQSIDGAAIRMQVRYGLMGLRRKSLAVSTGVDGQARIQGLPEDASLLRYEIGDGRVTAAITQDLSRDCRRRYEVTLK